MRAYTELFQSTGKWNHYVGNDINPDDVIKGNALFVFQLEPYFSESGHYMTLMKTGKLRLDFQFKTAWTGNLAFHLYFSFLLEDYSSLFFI